MLAGSIGAELSGPLLEMEHIVQQLLTTGKLSRPQVNALMSSLGTARRIAAQSQLLDHLAHNPIRQSHEHVALDARLRQALADNAGMLQGRAVDLVHRLQAVEVVLDPSLLETVLHAALSWMARPGYRLSITLEMQSMPEHALLSFKARPTVSDTNPEHPHASAPYRLSWWLLVEAASLARIPIQHAESAQNLSLTLEFQRTVKQLEKSNPLDLSSGADSWASSHSKLPTGQHILLVTADAGLVEVMTPLCRSSHVILDRVSSPEQARARCEIERPHMLIFDQRLNGVGLESVRRELLAVDPQIPVLEVTDDQHSLTMTSWVDDAIERINRDNLTSKLPSVLARLLSKSA
ncbi:MAG: hypothetical protein JZU58_26845 [Curvibacter lanceolatus]|uniref:hypothetical protein n=1 Tax=Curvibacter lanceolatus TaxID=86182 RepID=UPI0004CE84F3|nr:hypothetical protein [Curvibacter lanceolatus]MBV5295971.1 hypothetical protein [Curvibacter lanceolatus]